MASDKELGQMLGAGALLGASDRERILGLDNAAQQKATEYREYAKQVRERYKKQQVVGLAQALVEATEPEEGEEAL